MEKSHSLSHVVIIPDGNRRWAKERYIPIGKGHMEGYMRAKELLIEARTQNIHYVTFWSFSTENWSRNKEEVNDLLEIIYRGLVELRKEVTKEKTRFLHVGRKDRLGEKITTLVTTLEEETKKYKDFCVCVAIDYGGEDELQRAYEKLKGSQDTTKSVVDFLDTTLLAIPNPDFIIRTSGEQRTSGFMPLQSTYSEWCFEETLFPDFTVKHFRRCLLKYNARIRRFGS